MGSGRIRSRAPRDDRRYIAGRRSSSRALSGTLGNRNGNGAFRGRGAGAIRSDARPSPATGANRDVPEIASAVPLLGAIHRVPLIRVPRVLLTRALSGSAAASNDRRRRAVEVGVVKNRRIGVCGVDYFDRPRRRIADSGSVDQRDAAERRMDNESLSARARSGRARYRSAPRVDFAAQNGIAAAHDDCAGRILRCAVRDSQRRSRRKSLRGRRARKAFCRWKCGKPGSGRALHIRRREKTQKLALSQAEEFDILSVNFPTSTL